MVFNNCSVENYYDNLGDFLNRIGRFGGNGFNLWNYDGVNLFNL